MTPPVLYQAELPEDVPPTDSNHTRCIHVTCLSSPSNVVADETKVATGLLLSAEAVEGRLEGAAVLLDERVELAAFVVQRHIERTHQRLLSRRRRGT